MNLDAYLITLERTAKNLPEVAARWQSVPEPLADHYLDELSLLVAGAAGAIEEGARLGRLTDVVERIGRAFEVLRGVADAYPCTGMRPGDFAPRDTALATSSESWRDRELLPTAVPAIAA